MAVTEVQDSSLSTITGTWTTDSLAAYSGGTAKKTVVASSTLTYTGTFYSLWMLTALTKAGVTFTVQVDGGAVVTHSPNNTLYTGDTFPTYRTLYPLVRGLSDGSHTVVITFVSGTLYVDSLLPVTGTRLTGTTGRLACLGDSWTAGTGASGASMQYTNVLRQALQEHLGRPITLATVSTPGGSGGPLTTDTAIGSERMWAFSGTNIGGMYRLYSAIISVAVPEYLTVLFGPNDVASGQARPLDIWRHARSFLAFCEDAFDVLGAAPTVKIGFATPGYVSPNTLNFSETGLNALAGGAPSEGDLYEEAVLAVRHAVSAFPWCHLVDVFAEMDYRQDLVLPNANNDYGFHPNDDGHSVIGVAFLRGLLGVQV